MILNAGILRYSIIRLSNVNFYGGISMILNAGILRYSIIRPSNGECARQCEARI